MVKVGCILNIAALLVDCLGGSVLKVDTAGAVNKKDNFRFWIISNAWRVFFVSGPCILQLSCGTISKIA